MKVFKITISLLFVLFLVSCSILFICRDNLLSYFIEKVKVKLAKEKGLALNISEATFERLDKVSFQKVSLVPMGSDTLLKVESMKAEVKFAPLLKGSIAFKNFELKDAVLFFKDIDGKSNYSFLFKSDSLKKTKDTLSDFGKTLDRIIEKSFDVLPNNFSLERFNLNFQKDKYHLKFYIPEFSFINQKINSRFLITSGNKEEEWIAQARVDKKNYTFAGKLFGKDKKIKIPYADKKWNLKVEFDTLEVQWNEKEFKNGILELHGISSVKGLAISHPKLDSNAVIVNAGKINFNFKVGDNYLYLDSSSNGMLNQIPFQLFSYFQKQNTKLYHLKLATHNVQAQDFFNSLPDGLFSNFNGIKVQGKLSLKSEFKLDMGKIDSLYFHSELNDDGFKIIQFGETNFAKMNGPFLYTAYEKGSVVRVFAIDSVNPSFTPVSHISDYLKSAVLNSEDGSFFSHNGFREEAFRSAIIDNIKAGRFKRGGSTLSMQLVKNVFLSRSKTVARKLEEALIVWLIERNRLTRKERMFEVYMNAIEWGPLVYGVKEASHFYFAKHPSQLSIEESIFMASIIPRPKAFKYFFDENGNLKNHLTGYYKKLGGIMLRRGVITQEQYDNLKPNVELKGPARSIVIKPSPDDSMDLDDNPEEIMHQEIF